MWLKIGLAQKLLSTTLQYYLCKNRWLSLSLLLAIFTNKQAITRQPSILPTREGVTKPTIRTTSIIFYLSQIKERFSKSFFIKYCLHCLCAFCIMNSKKEQNDILAENVMGLTHCGQYAMWSFNKYVDQILPNFDPPSPPRVENY